ncbi:hypothetical protein MRX96_019500 [Rhipicephalus microplus]
MCGQLLPLRCTAFVADDLCVAHVIAEMEGAPYHRELKDTLSSKYAEQASRHIRELGRPHRRASRFDTVCVGALSSTGASFVRAGQQERAHVCCG